MNVLEDYDLNIYIHKKMKTDLKISLDSLIAAVPVLESLTDWSEDSLHEALINLVSELGIKNGQLLWPVRTALSGWEVTPGGAIEIAAVLGKAETLRRIQIGIDRLKSCEQV